MARRKVNDDSLTVVYRQADELLDGIRVAQRVVTDLEGWYLREIDQVRERYQMQMDSAASTLKELDAQLQALMKGARGQVFAGGDRVQLKHGILIRQLELKVHRARKMLERLEAVGRLDVIKIVKSVDWDQLEKWTDDELELVGTKRKPVESFGYEVTG